MVAQVGRRVIRSFLRVRALYVPQHLEERPADRFPDKLTFNASPSLFRGPAAASLCAHYVPRVMCQFQDSRRETRTFSKMPPSCRDNSRVCFRVDVFCAKRDDLVRIYPTCNCNIRDACVRELIYFNCKVNIFIVILNIIIISEFI